MRTAKYFLLFGFLVSLFGFASPAVAQNPDYPGYIGVMVVEGNGGMLIRGFIRDTPAEMLAQDGNISRNDTIVKLAGRPTRTLQELRAARNRIPDGKEAKMVLRSGNEFYHVWISRSEAVAAAAAYGLANPGSAAPGSAEPRAGAPARGDRFFKGGKGEGKEGDFRDIGSGDKSSSAKSPSANPPESEFREKK